jgi:hypothetical protein
MLLAGVGLLNGLTLAMTSHSEHACNSLAYMMTEKLVSIGLNEIYIKATLLALPEDTF